MAILKVRVHYTSLSVIRVSDYQVVGIRISEYQGSNTFSVFPDILITGILHPDSLVT